MKEVYRPKVTGTLFLTSNVGECIKIRLHRLQKWTLEKEDDSFVELSNSIVTIVIDTKIFKDTFTR